MAHHVRESRQSSKQCKKRLFNFTIIHNYSFKKSHSELGEAVPPKLAQESLILLISKTIPSLLSPVPGKIAIIIFFPRNLFIIVTDHAMLSQFRSHSLRTELSWNVVRKKCIGLHLWSLFA